MPFQGVVKIPKLKRYVKVHAHCRECTYCFHDLFFLGHRCIKRNMSVQLIDFACIDFYYMFAENDSDWAEKFIFGTKKAW